MTRHQAERRRPNVAALEQTFGAALALHERGLLDDAAQLYEAVLAQDRHHFHALYYLGAIRIQQQQPAEALPLIRRALKQKPRSAETHNNLGVALEGLRRYEAAIACYDKALALTPDYAEAHSNRGNALQALGRVAEAVASYEQALALKSDYATAHYNLAIGLQVLGRPADAVPHYQRAIALHPSYAEAHENLGSAFQILGRYEEAVASYQRAIGLMPTNPTAHDKLGTAFRLMGRHEAAVEHHVRSLVLVPEQAGAYSNLGLALHALGRWDEAMAAYAKALAFAPDNAEAHNFLGNTLQALERHGEAAAEYEKALALRPDYAEARNNLGNALQALGRAAEAIACYEAALALQPARADIHHNLGAAFESIGRIDAARDAYERAVDLAPDRPTFYRSLAELAPATRDEPRLAALERMALDVTALPEAERIELHFALGKVLADLGEDQRSFEHYLAGNALKRAGLAYDEAETLAQLDRIRAVFTSELMPGKQGFGDPSPVPVFVLGMPRSGTTLVEQILASHPQVFGAGELMDLDTAVDALGGSYPQVVAEAEGEKLRRLAGQYLAGLRGRAPEAGRITDKMPANFRFVGLIHLVLPNARIIHVRRDPIDTCLSCFTRLFAHDQPFAYDLGELGRYYRAYAALMAHWRSVLPEGAMIEVDYEAVVADLAGEARRLVAACGLSWDDACLAFHRTARPVRTASAAQVRRPIYRSSIGRWQPYRERLQPLLDVLAG